MIFLSSLFESSRAPSAHYSRHMVRIRDNENFVRGNRAGSNNHHYNSKGGANENKSEQQQQQQLYTNSNNSNGDRNANPYSSSGMRLSRYISTLNTIGSMS